MIKEATLYEKLDNNIVACNLCSHRCTIAPGKRGFCMVRENREGRLCSLIYNTVSSEAVDPIEKKPLFHFYPGSFSYSLGTIGCNFRCKHCQNWRIARMNVDESRNYTTQMTPQEAVSRAISSQAESISWTYNEPTIWYEYTYDSAKIAKNKGLATVYVTNGYITPEALKDISPYLDAFSVDIKGFTDKFYKDVASAKLEPVLEASITAKELGMHIEVTTLIIPAYNDSENELRQLSRWIHDNLGPDTPLHFSRFQPYYKMTNVEPTPLKTLEKAHEIATQEGLRFVYIGNVAGHKYENTFCPECGKMLIKRGFFSIEKYDITSDNKCSACGTSIPITGKGPEI